MLADADYADDVTLVPTSYSELSFTLNRLFCFVLYLPVTTKVTAKWTDSILQYHWCCDYMLGNVGVTTTFSPKSTGIGAE